VEDRTELSAALNSTLLRRSNGPRAHGPPQWVTAEVVASSTADAFSRVPIHPVAIARWSSWDRVAGATIDTVQGHSDPGPQFGNPPISVYHE